MEEKQKISEELEQRILSATTAEELLALAAESGEKLTLKEAQVLLEQMHSESPNSDDLSDEELGKVSGGGGGSELWLPYQSSVSAMTGLDGNNVYIYFDARSSYCRYWKCSKHNSTYNIFSYGIAQCIVCGEEARCGKCIHRQVQGWIFTHDYCTCPDVRASHGL